MEALEIMAEVAGSALDPDCLDMLKARIGQETASWRGRTAERFDQGFETQLRDVVSVRR